MNEMTAEMTAIERLFREEYEPLVRSLAVAFGLDCASDAVQEAFIEADHRWSRIGGYADPGQWIYRVAVNRARNKRRNQLRRSEILRSLRPPATRDIAEPSFDLIREISDLPDQMRLAIGLHYLADMPVEKVAELLGVAAGTVKSNLHDARKKLKAKLSEASYE